MAKLYKYYISISIPIHIHIYIYIIIYVCSYVPQTSLFGEIEILGRVCRSESAATTGEAASDFGSIYITIIIGVWFK